MKKYLENMAVDCWVETGHTLGRVQPCICMRADSEAAGLLLKAVDELARETPPAQRKVTFRSTRPDAIRSLRLRHSPATNELRKLCVAIENNTCILEFTPTGIADVTSALKEWIKGAEDFCLYPEWKKSERGEKDKALGELWFWTTMLP